MSGHNKLSDDNVSLQHSKRPSVDELLSHPLLLVRFFPARPDNTLTRPLAPSTNDSDQAAREAELEAREQRVTQQEEELKKRATELDGGSKSFIPSFNVHLHHQSA